MGVAGLAAYHSKSTYYSVGNNSKKGYKINSELRFGAVQMNYPADKNGELKPYTRCITANVKAKEKLSQFPADRDNIPDTVILNSTKHTDSETGKSVPVSVKYTTSYSDEGISCRKEIRDGDKKSERELWNLKYNNQDDYSKVRELLNGFGDDDRLTFASQKVFWEDYLGGKMDVDAFKDHYSGTKNGVIDFEGRMAGGESLRDIVSEPYAEYFNNQSFIGHVYTEQEMWDNWYARIEASQKANTITGSGIEPPTETIIEINGKTQTASDDYAQVELRKLLNVQSLWHWRDGVFGYDAEVYKNEYGKENNYAICSTNKF